MQDTFNYGKDTDDGELLMQFSEEERNEFFHADKGVIEEMKKLNEHISEVAKFTKRTNQEIIDFLFGDTKVIIESDEIPVVDVIQESSPAIIENSKEYIQKRIDYTSSAADIVPAKTPLDSITEEIEAPIVVNESEVDKELDLEEEKVIEPVIIEPEISQEELKAKFSAYDIIGELKENRRRVSKNGNYGFLDENGKEIVRCVYETVNDYCEGIAVVCCDDGTYGYIDFDGKQITECKFIDVMDFSEGLAAVKLNSKWGFIDKTGRVAIKYEFNDTGNFKDGKARVVVGRQEFIINKTGFKI